jgi:hypothetical protein
MLGARATKVVTSYHAWLMQKKMRFCFVSTRNEKKNASNVIYMYRKLNIF